jgi:hypothetical protein
MAEKYISFGPITNKDGSLTEFTKQFFGLSDKEAEEKVKEAYDRGPLQDMLLHEVKRLRLTFPEIRVDLYNSGLTFKASVPDRDQHFIIIAYHPISGHYSTHATEYGNKSVCCGHYDFPTFESARIDALERALHR